MRRTRLGSATILSTLLLLTACGGDEPGTSREERNDPESVAINFITAFAQNKDCEDAAAFFEEGTEGDFLDRCDPEDIEEDWKIDRASVEVDLNSDEDEADVDMELTTEDGDTDDVDVDVDLTEGGDWVITGVSGRFFA